MTVADLLVETLASVGIERVYGLPGDSLNGFTDSIRRHPAVAWVHVRHEETAAFAAGAEAQLTGTVAACAGSCGPGNTHLINGLYDAHRSRVPVIAIAAQIPSGEIGTSYFQETHPERLFRECSHYCELVATPAQLPRMLQGALQAAVTLGGVAVLVIPGDVLQMAAPAAKPALRLAGADSSMRPTDDRLAAAARALDGAKRVTILAGEGCANARDELFAIAERLAAPIVHSLRAKERLEYDNPYDIGLTGLIGFSTGAHAMRDCDALLMVGTDFPYVQFYPDDATVVQIDIRGENIGRRTQVDHPLAGDAKTTLAALLPLLAAREDRTHLDTALADYARVRTGLDELATGKAGRPPIHPQYLARVVDERATHDAIFTCDVGTTTIWAARYLRMTSRRRLLGSWVHGSMAGALPQAIAAQLVHPDRQVVTLSGDGGFAMLLGDLLTLKQLNLPIKIVVFNNASLAFVELEMKAAGILNFGTDLDNPNFAAMGAAAGLLGIRVEDPGDLDDAVRRAFAHDGPAILDVVVNRQELSIPPTITPEQALGFGAYALKAVFSGRGDEIVDLAKTNLLR